MKHETGLQFAAYRTKMNAIKHRFDFEIGYLVKSPCKECDRKNNFPKCADDCDILDNIQSIMAKSISCSRRI